MPMRIADPLFGSARRGEGLQEDVCHGLRDLFLGGSRRATITAVKNGARIAPVAGRGDWIRTSDPHTPSVMRYQAALRPDRGLASRQQSPITQAMGQTTATQKIHFAPPLGARAGGDPARLSACGAHRLAGARQSRLDGAGRGRDDLSRQQRPPLGHRHAGECAGPRLDALRAEERFRRAGPGRPLGRLRLRRGARLSRHAALAGHHTCDDLVGADRRQAGDARRMGIEPALSRPRRPAAARGISPPMGSDPRRLRARRARAAAAGSTTPATAGPTPSTGRPASSTRSRRATPGPPAACGSRASRRASGRPSCRASSGATARSAPTDELRSSAWFRLRFGLRLRLGFGLGLGLRLRVEVGLRHADDEALVVLAEAGDRDLCASLASVDDRPVRSTESIFPTSAPLWS